MSVKSTIIRPLLAGANPWQRGSAAIEVLLLIPFIVLIWALLFNMGYNADRHRKAQAAMRLGAFLYVTGMATSDRQQAAAAANSQVNDAIFGGAADATLTFPGSSQSNIPNDHFTDEPGLLGGASSRLSVAVAVKRSPPYPKLVSNAQLRGGYIVSSNTWTYCEMKDDDFGGAGMDVIRGASTIGEALMWLFGGCGGDTFDLCGEDECLQ